MLIQSFGEDTGMALTLIFNFNESMEEENFFLVAANVIAKNHREKGEFEKEEEVKELINLVLKSEVEVFFITLSYQSIPVGIEVLETFLEYFQGTEKEFIIDQIENLKKGKEDLDIRCLFEPAANKIPC